MVATVTALSAKNVGLMNGLLEVLLKVGAVCRVLHVMENDMQRYEPDLSYGFGDATMAICSKDDNGEFVRYDDAMAEIDALKSAPWYLIYEGSSEDGMGRGKYMCRTLDLSFAIKHLKENDSPYFTGHVDVVSSERPIARFRPYQLDDLKRFVESMS